VPPADAARLSDALTRLELTMRGAARRYGSDTRTLQRCLAGRKAVPPHVWAGLEADLAELAQLGDGSG
jgi:hypothetical protein